MTENKEVVPSVAKKKTKKTVKVTTGAWWKSTIKKGESTGKSDEGNLKKEEKKQPRLSPPRGRRRKPPVSAKRSHARKFRGKKTHESQKAHAQIKDKVSPEHKTDAVKKSIAEPVTAENAVTKKVVQKPGRRPKRRRFLKKAWDKKSVGTAPLFAILSAQDTTLPASTSRHPFDKQEAVAKKQPATVTRTTTVAPVINKVVTEERKTGWPKKRDKRKITASPPAEVELLEQEVVPDDENKPIIKLLINAEEPEECRLALLENGRLESIHVSTVTRAHTKNNIYKAKIVAIEPNLQAAFVDFGNDKNGFLPFSEIHPEYFKQEVNSKIQHLIETHQWKKLSIIDVIEKGQEVLVQVVKEEVGKKGANMTTYLSLPGRCVVLMPGSDSTGVSRKIMGEERRGNLRETMKSMEIPEGIGWIVRTASIDITKTALQRDVTYLLRLWKEVKKKGQTLSGVGMVYQDQNSVLRFLREHFDPAIQEILVDDKNAMEQVKEFISLLPSKQRTVKVKLHRGSRPIFNQFSVEDQIESIYQPMVNLPSGGSIVIDPTEALVAIDVNSGSTSKGQNFEASIFQANIEAATELARQLRLRDLGGLIVVDFIDMRSKKNIREVEKQLKASMKRDKAKVDTSRISKFGLMQISRQKLGAPIEAGNYRVCEHCKGRGTVRSVETLALFYLRRIQTGASRKIVRQVECHFPLDVAQYLLNQKRQELQELENKYHTEVTILANPGLKPADHEILFHKVEKEN